MNQKKLSLNNVHEPRNAEFTAFLGSLLTSDNNSEKRNDNLFLFKCNSSFDNLGYML